MIPIIKKIWLNADSFSTNEFNERIKDLPEAVIPEVCILLSNNTQIINITNILTNLHEYRFGYDKGFCKIVFCTENSLNTSIIENLAQHDTFKPRFEINYIIRIENLAQHDTFKPRFEINYIIRSNKLNLIIKKNSAIYQNIIQCRDKYLKVKITIIEENDIENILFANNIINQVKSCFVKGKTSIVTSIDYEAHPKLFNAIIAKCKSQEDYLNKFLEVIIKLNYDSYMYFCGMLNVICSQSMKLFYNNNYKICIKNDDGLGDCFFYWNLKKHCDSCYKNAKIFCEVMNNVEQIASIAKEFNDMCHKESPTILEADWDYIT